MSPQTCKGCLKICQCPQKHEPRAALTTSTNYSHRPPSRLEPMPSKLFGLSLPASRRRDPREFRANVHATGGGPTRKAPTSNETRHVVELN